MNILPKPDPVYAVAIQDADLTACDTNYETGRHNPPQGSPLQGKDFNFFIPEKPDQKLVQFDIALYSVGHVAKKGLPALKATPPSMLSRRARPGTMLIGDSGGYQIGTGKIQNYDAVAMYEWLAQHTDLAMTIDIPPWLLNNKKKAAQMRWKSFDACLKETVKNLKILRENHYFGHKWLIVLQGESHYQAAAWLQAMTNELYEVDDAGEPLLDESGNKFPYIPAGFAFAGTLKTDLYRLTHDFLSLKELGLLHADSWIHFLGKADLKMTAFMTVFQDALRNHWGLDKATLSCDTASTSKSVRITETFHVGYTISDDRIAYEYDKYIYHEIEGVLEPLHGIATRISAHVVQNDLIRLKPSTGKSRLDAFSHNILVNQSLDVMQQGF